MGQVSCDAEAQHVVLADQVHGQILSGFENQVSRNFGRRSPFIYAIGTNLPHDCPPRLVQRAVNSWWMADPRSLVNRQILVL